MLVVMVFLIISYIPLLPVVGKETVKVCAIYSFSNLIIVAIITLLTRYRSVFAMLYCPASVLVRAIISYMLARGIIPVNSSGCT
jgi:hypothetical protein